jgi:hypothetical protein
VSTKRERSFPGAPDDGDSESLIHLSKYPHNQRLRVHDSFSLSLLGRMLRICLRFCNDQFTDQMTVLLHKGLEEEPAKMHQDLWLPQAATRQGPFTSLLVRCSTAEGA